MQPASAPRIGREAGFVAASGSQTGRKVQFIATSCSRQPRDERPAPRNCEMSVQLPGKDGMNFQLPGSDGMSVRLPGSRGISKFFSKPLYFDIFIFAHCKKYQ